MWTSGGGGSERPVLVRFTNRAGSSAAPAALAIALD